LIRMNVLFLMIIKGQNNKKIMNHILG